MGIVSADLHRKLPRGRQRPCRGALRPVRLHRPVHPAHDRRRGAGAPLARPGGPPVRTSFQWARLRRTAAAAACPGAHQGAAAAGARRAHPGAGRTSSPALPTSSPWSLPATYAPSSTSATGRTSTALFSQYSACLRNGAGGRPSGPCRASGFSSDSDHSDSVYRPVGAPAAPQGGHGGPSPPKKKSKEGSYADRCPADHAAGRTGREPSPRPRRGNSRWASSTSRRWATPAGRTPTSRPAR